MPRLPLRARRAPKPVDPAVLRDAVVVAVNPAHAANLRPDQAGLVKEIAGALTKATMPTGAYGSGGTGGIGVQLGSGRAPKGKLNAQDIAQRAIANLSPSSTLTPAEIEAALHEQGLSWVEPFAPGRPLTPYYGYTRRPRQIDYVVGRNITTEPRDTRIPFTVLKEIWQGYDIAQICTRHIINDLRSMRLHFNLLEGEQGDIKAVEAAKAFLRKPDGKTPWGAWLARWAMDIYRYDAGTVYKQRNRAGKVIALKVLDGTTIAPMLDYFGDVPTGAAPAYQQFIQGIPWDWLKASDVIYQPLWPLPESPYGLAPIESVLINANTDVRLQWYFLNFFTAGQVPEAFATAPPDASDPDSLAEFQEIWNSWTEGNQAQRYGLRWIPAGTDITQYKPQKFDPTVAEYVMRRTVSAFGLVPQDLGFTATINRSTGDTQMDVQFRVNTLPNVSHFESLIDGVLQTDLTLPVEIKFDTGREKEDRLMEAQAHQIYVSIGAESPDEVRDKVLALPVDAAFPIPRMYDSQRLGPVPLSYMLATSGDIDIDTKAPKAGTVPAQQFVIPGAMQPDPTAAPVEDKETASASTPAERAKAHQQTGEHSGPGHDTTVAPKGGPPGSGKPADVPGYGTSNLSQRVAENHKISVAEVQGNNKRRTKANNNAAKDLERWRANARNRVAKGQSPRRFLDSEIPDDVADEVWEELRWSKTKADVDALFKATQDEGTRPGPWGHLENVLVSYWTPIIAAWLPMHINSSDVAQRWIESNPPTGRPMGTGTAPDLPGQGDPLVLSAQSFAAELRVDPDQAVASLRALRADAYLAGAKDGIEQLAQHGRTADSLIAQAVIRVDWDHWEPGHLPAADLLDGTGLRDLLDQAGIEIKGISDTTRERIASVLADGVRTGANTQDIAAQLDKVLHNRARAKLIARTETNRAMTRAATETYRRDGVSEWNLVTAPGACAICLAVQAADPHPVGDVADEPPIHPACRCATAPVV